MVTFAAALQCPENGCGHCEICRLVLSDADADVYFAERAGLSWRIDELREADRVSRRRPLGAGLPDRRHRGRGTDDDRCVAQCAGAVEVTRRDARRERSSC